MAAEFQLHVVELPREAAGQRLDQALAAALPQYSRARLQRWIREGVVRLEGAASPRSSDRMLGGERIEVRADFPETSRVEAESLPLQIVYEDEALLVLNKPAGLVVHPAPGNPDNTLVNALIAHCGTSLSGIGGVRRPGIVHRLDKDTSGVMVVAKNDETHQRLSRMFAAHDLTRIYQAVVWGTPPARRGTIEAAIGRHPVDRKRMAVRKTSGRAALTEYWLEQRFGPPLRPLASLVGAKLGTGRTHQVRVHLAHIGCPVVGDPLYARRRNTAGGEALKGLGRQALHASVLEFRHPRSGRRMTFASELPQDIKTLIGSLNSVK